ncbi:MAG: ligase-associated DNA damage response endonuclease PdeM [Bacteroidota bacterium]
MKIDLLGQTFMLHPFKAMYWEEESILLIADLHLGKSRHFRKEGFPVPQAVGDTNYDKLISLFLDFKPARVVFLGDLFHSDYNKEWIEFEDLIGRFPDIEFDLVKGNHDILDVSLYAQSRMQIHYETLLIKPFALSHEPLDDIEENWFNLSGHIHPCVWLKGRGRQKLRLPCFYFNKYQGILPAFGAFTGMAAIAIKKGDRVYGVTDDAVMAL